MNIPSVNGFYEDREIKKWFPAVCFLLAVAGTFSARYLLLGINVDLIFVIGWIIFFFKLLFIDRRIAESQKLFYLGKVVDVIVVSALVMVKGLNPLAASLYAVAIISASLARGSYAVGLTTLFSAGSYIELIVLKIIEGGFGVFPLALNIINVLLLSTLGYVSFKYALESEANYEEVETSLKQQIESHHELVTLNAEIKRELTELQSKNQKATKNLAELSTLKQISEVINSTLDIKKLLNLVNDIILGLLGVTYCTIFLKETDNTLSIQSSNVNDQEYLDTLKEKVVSRIITLVEDGRKVLDNNIDPYTYPRALQRGIQSISFVPIINKGRVLGLILAEYTIEKGMDEQAKKFIETIANQIGVAIENAILYNQMEKMATTDALTKVYNRMYFNQNFGKEVQKAKENNYPICAAMLDIDFFKRFNDTYGHDFGDEVLKSTAQLVKKNLDSNGMVARFGGEEFVILFKHADLETGYRLADNLRKLIENNLVTHNGSTVKVTVSMGVSECPAIATDEWTLLKTADEGLYKAKEEGRNCVRKGVRHTE